MKGHNSRFIHIASTSCSSSCYVVSQWVKRRLWNWLVTWSISWQALSLRTPKSRSGVCITYPWTPFPMTIYCDILLKAPQGSQALVVEEDEPHPTFYNDLPPTSPAAAHDVVDGYGSHPTAHHDLLLTAAIAPDSSQVFFADWYSQLHQSRGGGLPDYANEESIDYSSSSFHLFFYFFFMFTLSPRKLSVLVSTSNAQPIIDPPAIPPPSSPSRESHHFQIITEDIDDTEADKKSYASETNIIVASLLGAPITQWPLINVGWLVHW